MHEKELQETIKHLVAKGKGILAADESVKTATKRLQSIGVESTDETRRLYRQVVIAAPGMEDYIAGVILYEETLHQKTNEGIPFPKHLQNKGIVPGIKVDEGLAHFNGTDEECTKGLETLAARLREYKKHGCKFAKWRAVYKISLIHPSDAIIKKNAEDLAKYAKICHAEGFVPIVEPEILIDGEHSIDQSEEVSRKVLKALYAALKHEHVELQYTILKPSMVISGKQSPHRADVHEVAKRTLKVLKECVPWEVPSINFLSGGQSPKEATAHLNEMHALDKSLPWHLSFSYARALQEPALSAWKGKDGNIPKAQAAFVKRAMLNSLASQGKYDSSME
jgi:fructose-bisphosphate aldolase, class I